MARIVDTTLGSEIGFIVVRRGNLVPVRDSDALSNAVSDVIEESEKLENQGESSRAKAFAEFDVSRVNTQALNAMKI